jgi:hypothetical protein
MKLNLFNFVACAVLFGGATQLHAATVVGGGGLLTGSDANQIGTWLDATALYSGSLQFTNAFTKVVGSTSLNFHNAVDGIGPTIVVMSATYTDNAGVAHTNLIGGFNPQSWNSNGYNYVPEQ